MVDKIASKLHTKCFQVSTSKVLHRPGFFRDPHLPHGLVVQSSISGPEAFQSYNNCSSLVPVDKKEALNLLDNSAVRIQPGSEPEECFGVKVSRLFLLILVLIKHREYRFLLISYSLDLDFLALQCSSQAKSKDTDIEGNHDWNPY